MQVQVSRTIVQSAVTGIFGKEKTITLNDSPRGPKQFWEISSVLADFSEANEIEFEWVGEKGIVKTEFEVTMFIGTVEVAKQLVSSSFTEAKTLYKVPGVGNLEPFRPLVVYGAQSVEFKYVFRITETQPTKLKTFGTERGSFTVNYDLHFIK